MSKVTIAAMNGTVSGGGAELSACFDFRFMVSDQDFTIGQFEVFIGTIPGAGGTQRWPRLIGKAKALEMMLTGQLIPAGEAKRIGMITDCFAKSEFHGRVQEFAQAMGRRPAPAIGSIKRAVHQGFDVSFRHALSIEAEESVSCLQSPVTEQLMKKYVDYIDANITGSSANSPPTLKQTIDYLQSDDFLDTAAAK